MTPRIGIVPRAITLVPLAALSAVWTVNIARTPGAEMSSVAGSAVRPPSSTAPATTVPTVPPALPGSALVVPPDTQAPASVWGAKPASANAVVAAQAMSSQAIPAVALAAYQRAATVIDTADRSCRLDWSLLAAIGRIESDHGTHANSRLSDAGLATPGIVGPALTGLGGTALVKDTDAGRLDGDTRYDHAVGPMQFLPSTWSVVGVDADGDGQRDPQDIDDAALAAGVYLCSGAEDLSTDAGRQAALLRYNHSASYVSTVMSVAAAYQSGAGLDSGLGGLVATRAMSVVPAVVVEPETEPSTGGKRHKRHRHHAISSFTGAATHTSNGAVHDTVNPPTPPAPEPKQPPGGGTTDKQVPATVEELTTLCTEQIDLTFPDATDDARVLAIDACTEKFTGETRDDAEAQVEDFVATLPDTIDGLEATAPTTEPTPEPTEPTEPTAGATTVPPTGASSGPGDSTTEQSDGNADSGTDASDSGIAG